MAEATFQRGLDRVHRIEVVIAKGLAAHLAPNQFLRIALRAVRWQPVHREVVGHHQRFGLMPAGPIHKHQNMLVGMPPGHFGQVERHRGGVGVGQDQAG